MPTVPDKIMSEIERESEIWKGGAENKHWSSVNEMRKMTDNRVANSDVTALFYEV